jgi:hypothetical protein
MSEQFAVGQYVLVFIAGVEFEATIENLTKLDATVRIIGTPGPSFLTVERDSLKADHPITLRPADLT